VGWMTAAFAFGTAHWYSSAAGTVWHTSQVCGLTFLLLAAREAVGRGRPALCGLWLGLAFAARPPLAFGLPFFLPLLMGRPWRDRVRAAVMLGLPLALCGSLILGYNLVRFGSWTDFGYTYMKTGPVLEPFLRQGLFSLRHLPRNLYYALLHLPRPMSRLPFLAFDPMGNSVLFCSPFLIGAVLRRPLGPWWWCAWTASAAVLGTNLLYFSSGYAQFGYRYSMDAMPFLVLLAAAGLAGRSAVLVKTLVLSAVAFNFLGQRIPNWSLIKASSPATDRLPGKPRFESPTRRLTMIHFNGE
jgi:hypothetical protein